MLKSSFDLPSTALHIHEVIVQYSHSLGLQLTGEVGGFGPQYRANVSHDSELM